MKLDADTHLNETRGLWSRYTDPSDRHLAIDIEYDDLGYAWLVQGGRTIDLVEVHHPNDVAAMGAYRERRRQGLPPEVRYEEAVPRHFWDPEERLGQLDDFGLDGAVIFPNFGLLWERPLEHDLEATLANMRAYNRWAEELVSIGKGRFFPVAHISLRDLNWLEEELRSVSEGGIRLAMTAPSLVDGKALSHPDLDRAWSLFEEHGVAPVFHVAAFPHPFHDGWYEADPDEVTPVLSSVFLWTAPALSLADLAINGVFEAHPRLRIGVMELSSVWVPWFLVMLDGGFDFYGRFNGRPYRRLAERPSTYLLKHTRVASFCYENPSRLIDQVGDDMFMFSSDYPHAEGIARPVEDYEAIAGPITGHGAEQLYCGNLKWLLGIA